jgi:hypothetical protein
LVLRRRAFVGLLSAMVLKIKAFRCEGAIDVPGLPEMIRLLANDQMIPKRESKD